MFRAADPGGTVVAFRHAAFQEALAAEVLRSPRGPGRRAGVGRGPRLTEQVREFLASGGVVADYPGECILPAGVYLVGPGHHLMARRIERPVVFDRFPVTVARYKRFLEAVEEGGSAQWDHPAMPEGYTHQPWRERLRVAEYYEDPAYRGPSGGRGQLVERVRVRPVRGQAAAHLAGMGGRGAGPRRSAVPVG